MAAMADSIFPGRGEGRGEGKGCVGHLVSEDSWCDSTSVLTCNQTKMSLSRGKRGTQAVSVGVREARGYSSTRRFHLSYAVDN